MPFVPTRILESSVFLYESVSAAEAGERWGGSGFLVGVSAPNASVHIYVVTNAHVVDGGARVARVRHSDGTVECVDGATHWESHSRGDDVSALYLGLHPEREFDFLERAFFLTREELRPFGVGPGDYCFMVGRFTRPNGQQFDRPVLRFGNLAMLPEPIFQKERAYWQESFLVDMRSLSGFSGAAVIAYFGSHGPRRRRADVQEPSQYDAYNQPWSDLLGDAWLLGIDWGHLPVALDLYPPGSSPSDPEAQPTGVGAVNSGMSAVVPAWKIADVLDLELLRDQRTAAERAQPESGGVLDRAAGPVPLEFTKFEELTRKLLRVPKSDLDKERRRERR